MRHGQNVQSKIISVCSYVKSALPRNPQTSASLTLKGKSIRSKVSTVRVRRILKPGSQAFKRPVYSKERYSTASKLAPRRCMNKSSKVTPGKWHLDALVFERHHAESIKCDKYTLREPFLGQGGVDKYPRENGLYSLENGSKNATINRQSI